MARVVGMPLLAQEHCADREDYVKQRTTDNHSGLLGQDRKPHGFQGQMMYISVDCAREWSVIDFAIFVRPTLYSRWMQGFNWFDELRTRWFILIGWLTIWMPIGTIDDLSSLEMAIRRMGLDYWNCICMDSIINHCESFSSHKIGLLCVKVIKSEFLICPVNHHLRVLGNHSRRLLVLTPIINSYWLHIAKQTVL